MSDSQNLDANNLCQSQILINDKCVELINLCEFSVADKWTLLYRGSRDGFKARNFHERCDDKSPTLTIIQAKISNYIFGGYTENNWNGSNDSKSDSNAFIFSLTNKDSKPCKMPTKNAQNSIVGYSGYGPVFGVGGCIRIDDNSDTSKENYSGLGCAVYEHPEYAFESKEAQTFLSGSEHFQLGEIEVYHKF